MEIGETAAQGAIREAQEEACADIVIENVLAVYSIPDIAQVQVIHVAHLAKPEFECGPESQEVSLFEWDEIPWEDLAFPSVHWALRHFREIRGKAEFSVFSNPTGETGSMTSPPFK
jgi:ADP-ribose pyrophosphatase YjhB (NUDIX family)